MTKTLQRMLLLSATLAVAACHEPYPVYYVNQAPPPLQPYMGPPIAAPVVTTTRRVKKRYVRRHHRPRCRCNQVQ